MSSATSGSGPASGQRVRPGFDPGRVAAGHLTAAVDLLRRRLQYAVDARRSVDPSPDDAFRGLYVADQDADRLLAGGWPLISAPSEEIESLSVAMKDLVDQAEDAGHPSRLRSLQRRFELTALDLELLVVALAPDLDSRIERLYGYLNDDVTRRRASIGLALELAGVRPTDAEARGCLRLGSALVGGGLVIIEDMDRPFLTRSLRVPDRVTSHLLGDDTPDRELLDLLLSPSTGPDVEAEPLVRALAAGAKLAYWRDDPGSSGRAVASSALAGIGLGAINLDLNRLYLEADPAGMAKLAGREARLGGSGLVVSPVEALGDPADPRVRAAIAAFADLPLPVLIGGRSPWDPLWSVHVPVFVDAPVLDVDLRIATWMDALGDDLAPDVDLATAVGELHLTPEQVDRASQSGRWQAAWDGSLIGAGHLRIGVRSQNGAGLERMARRIEPAVGWADLVLPPAPLMALKELAARVHHRETVLDHWGMRPGGGRGRGVTALFAGDSGTGKTMSAEVLSGDLGLDLYTINLSTVVDKYIGETEKNLERIFSEVDGINGVLLFDEADAIFGKRSEVSSAHDRYANIEVAYLLQRIETFDGLAVLATNLRANVDEAFTRRLDALIDFPFPDEEHRLVLWSQCLGASVELSDDVDLEFLAHSFELSGGNIRSVALTAAYLAAAESRTLTMPDMIRAVHREYRKLGRLSVASEFGIWFELISKEM